MKSSPPLPNLYPPPITSSICHLIWISSLHYIVPVSWIAKVSPPLPLSLSLQLAPTSPPLSLSRRLLLTCHLFSSGYFQLFSGYLQSHKHTVIHTHIHSFAHTQLHTSYTTATLHRLPIPLFTPYTAHSYTAHCAYTPIPHTVRRTFIQHVFRHYY